MNPLHNLSDAKLLRLALAVARVERKLDHPFLTPAEADRLKQRLCGMHGGGEGPGSEPECTGTDAAHQSMTPVLARIRRNGMVSQPSLIEAKPVRPFAETGDVDPAALRMHITCAGTVFIDGGPSRDFKLRIGSRKLVHFRHLCKFDSSSRKMLSLHVCDQSIDPGWLGRNLASAKVHWVGDATTCPLPFQTIKARLSRRTRGGEPLKDSQLALFDTGGKTAGACPWVDSR